METGGYSSTSVASTPSDLFTRMMFRMTRPSSTHEFLTVLADAAKFPRYPDGVDHATLTTMQFDLMVERAYIFCDKIVTAYTLLCTDMEDVNVLPSMHSGDEAFKGLKGLFINNFKPSCYMRTLLANFDEEQKELLKHCTFQQFTHFK
jgi:hypothetical protein